MIQSMTNWQKGLCSDSYKPVYSELREYRAHPASYVSAEHEERSGVIMPPNTTASSSSCTRKQNIEDRADWRSETDVKLIGPRWESNFSATHELNGLPSIGSLSGIVYVLGYVFMQSKKSSLSTNSMSLMSSADWISCIQVQMDISASTLYSQCRAYSCCSWLNSSLQYQSSSSLNSYSVGRGNFSQI